MVRKSRTDGETLPMIIESISSSISEMNRSLFFNKLFQYGYITACEDRYILGFHLRSYQVYHITETFPSITSDHLNKGISEVTYSLDLNTCNDYITQWDKVMNILKGGIPIGEP